jgi:hypothetical protein
MKKIAIAAAVVLAGLSGAYAQGTVKIYNITSTFLISTNGTAQNGNSTGKIAGAADSYYFVLLTDVNTPTSSNPLTGGWTVAQSGGSIAYGNNYTPIAGGLTSAGAANGTSIDNWTPGVSENVEVVGWSASLGTTWAQIEAELTSGQWTAAGYYGISGEGLVASGGVGSPASPATTIFNTSGGIASGFNLNGVTSAVPEPGTMALAGLGGLSLLAFRRKK